MKEKFINIIRQNTKGYALFAFSLFVITVQLFRNLHLAQNGFGYFMLFFPFLMMVTGLITSIKQKNSVNLVFQSFGAVLFAMFAFKFFENLGM